MDTAPSDVHPETLITAAEPFPPLACQIPLTSLLSAGHHIFGSVVHYRNSLLNTGTKEQLVRALPGGWRRFWNRGREEAAALLLA